VVRERITQVENWVKKRYLTLEKVFELRLFALLEAEVTLRKTGIETSSVR